MSATEPTTSDPTPTSASTPAPDPGPAPDRVMGRADDGPAEELSPGRDDKVAQARAILAESDQRQADRETSDDTVEHRSPTGDR